MLVLTVPRLWQRGMFADGMTYAVVARNMALGVGDFWAPSLSDTIYSRFFEQPPLGMALQAIAFALAGDHFAVERVFSLLMFGANAVLIAAMWRRLLPAQDHWLPILLWLVPSVVTWAVINNMLENSQAVFTSLACYALLRTSDRRPRSPPLGGRRCGGLCRGRYLDQRPGRPLPADCARPLPYPSRFEQTQTSRRSSGLHLRRWPGRWRLPCWRRRQRVPPSAHS